MPRLIISCLETASPKKRKAKITAKIGEVLLRKASLERETSFTARLKTKNVIVPKIALIITSFQASCGTSKRSTFSFTAMI